MRNRFIEAGLAIGIGFTLNACGDGRATQPTIPGDNPRPAATRGIIPERPEILVPTGDALLRNEANRLGVKRSDQEQYLWQTFATKRQTEPKDLRSIPIEEAEQKLSTALSLMKTSENKKFQHAAGIFEPLMEERSIRFVWDLRLIGSDVGMYTTPEEKDEKIHYVIGLNPSNMFNNPASTDLTNAFHLAHEGEHVENFKEFFRQRPDLSAKEKIVKAREQDRLEEERRGFTIEAEAYIIEYGLGYRGAVNTSHHRLAVKLLECVGNNECWGDYVKTILPPTSR